MYNLLANTLGFEPYQYSGLQNFVFIDFSNACAMLTNIDILADQMSLNMENMTKLQHAEFVIWKTRWGKDKVAGEMIVECPDNNKGRRGEIRSDN